MAVVYMLIRPYGKKTPAYIGIGDELRPYEHRMMAARGNHPNKILQKIFNKAVKYGFNDLNIKIISEMISWENACDLEKVLIKKYGRLDQKTGCLANLTN